MRTCYLSRTGRTWPNASRRLPEAREKTMTSNTNARHLRNGVFALALMCFGAASALAQSAPAAIEGFRSARFEMTEAQVQQAIEADFKIGAQQIQKQMNKVDRTMILSIKVPELLPESGIAQ